MSAAADHRSAPAGRREQQKQHTHQAIQKAAFGLFAEQGYEATTCEQIAAAAGVAPATFYRHYPTKEDLVFDDGFDPMLAALLAQRPPHEAPLEVLRNVLVDGLAALTPAELDAFHLRVRLGLSARTVRARLYDQLRDTEAFFAHHLAARMGAAPDDIGVRAFIAAVLAAVTVALETWAQDGGDPATCLTAVFSALEHHLTARPAAPKRPSRRPR
jgi:AcrR family transcriptional regulator